MSFLARVARGAFSALRNSKVTSNGAELFQQQTRRMGGGGHGGAPWYRAYDGKAPPPQFQGPDFLTYAGLTLPKPKPDADYYYTKALGAVVWGTMFYHLFLNFEEHWYGDIWVFEKDVQTNGWDDENGHGHGHH